MKMSNEKMFNENHNVIHVDRMRLHKKQYRASEDHTQSSCSVSRKILHRTVILGQTEVFMNFNNKKCSKLNNAATWSIRSIIHDHRALGPITTQLIVIYRLSVNSDVIVHFEVYLLLLFTSIDRLVTDG